MDQLPVEPSHPNNGSPETTSSVLNKLTDPVNRLINFAELQCAGEGLIAVDSSHLFAGFLLIDPSTSNGLKLLSGLNVDVEALKTSLRNSGFIASPTWPPPSTAQALANLSVGQEARDVFQTASSFVASFGHDRIGTEHLLLAFMSLPETYGYRVLSGFGVTLDSAHQLLGQWVTAGTYERETVNANASRPSAARAVRTALVYRIYYWTRLGYLLLILAPLLTSFFLSPKLASSLYVYMSMMGQSLYYYVFPYVISTYAMTFLLRIRTQKDLLGMPPQKAMVGLEMPFGLCVLVGILLVGAIVMMFQSFISSKHYVISGVTADIPALFFGVLVMVNCCATVVSHWLLTFNVLGPALKPRRKA